jgi:hypothetical protein
MACSPSPLASEGRDARLKRDPSHRHENQIEYELRHSRAQLAEAKRVARIASAEWDLTNDHTTVSDGLFQIDGLTPDQFDPSSEGAQRAPMDLPGFDGESLVVE